MCELFQVFCTEYVALHKCLGQNESVSSISSKKWIYARLVRAFFSS